MRRFIGIFGLYGGIMFVMFCRWGKCCVMFGVGILVILFGILGYLIIVGSFKL